MENNEGLKGLAIASIVCGTASWLVFAIILAPLGTIFGILAMKSKDETTKTIAIVGLVISIVALSLTLLSIAIVAGSR